jgi:hypothetical protein
MGLVALRVFIYSLLPVIIAAIHVGLDKCTKPRENTRNFLVISLWRWCGWKWDWWILRSFLHFEFGG